MDSPRVYSYLRFSDPKQAAGHSVERQIAYATRWAADRGLALDASLTLRDEGLSAYHQRHVKQGALGAFLRAVDEGRIARGSVLIVEGLDRLSRAEPIQAQAQLAQIINAGITVVTASDGREYHREALKAQPMDLVYSLLVMIRAHEESDTKSKRVKAAVRRQCEGWIAGTWRGVIRNGKDPAWVQLVDGKWQLIPDRADTMRRAIDLWLKGYGFAAILSRLAEDGADLSMLPKTPTSLYKIVSGDSLAGTKIMEIDSERFELRGYWPPLLDDETLARVQVARSTRTRAKGKGEIAGIITGIGVTYCGYCGHAMAGQALSRRRKDGTRQDGHRRLQCSGGTHRCEHAGGCSVIPIERAILTWCADQMRLDMLWEGAADTGNATRTALATAQQRAANIEAQLQRLTDAMLADDSGAPPITWARKARDLESELDAARQQVEHYTHELRVEAHGNKRGQAEQWAEIREGVLALDNDQRMRARRLVAETFDRIVVYHHGVQPGDLYHSPIDLVLLAKGGTPRLLRIHRRTGELIAQEDVIG